MRLVLAVLATYRVAQLISIDDGPLGAFKRFRLWCGRHAAHGDIAKSLADLVHCPYCTGVWLAMIFALFVPAPWLLAWLGVAGGQAALETLTTRDE